MKASELINLYNAGRRDFSEECLRGQNFAGKDLSGAIFRGCDIRGTNFQEANLSKTKFIKAKGGLTLKYKILLLLTAMILAALSGFLLVWSGYYISWIFKHSSGKYDISGWLIIASLFIFSVTSYCKGLAAGAVGGAVGGAVAGAFAVVEARDFAVAGAVGGAFAVAVAGAFAVAGAVGGAFAVAGAGALAGNFVGAKVGNFAEAGAVAGALTLLACVLSYRAIKGDPRDAWLREFALAFASWGGTSFYSATVTDADFTGATLKNCDLRAKSLIRTRFKEVKNLDLARVGKNLLSQPNVRELLSTGYGYKKSYSDADLQGANLDGANLNEANLKQCNLNDASLRATNLEWANLSQISAINTNFTRCNLTGACIEAWNIDQTTILDEVDCQFLFLLEKDNKYGSRERRPHDPNKMFEPGDFEKLYQEIINTVQLLLKNGFNSEAFKTAFNQIVQENPNISYDNIQGFEKKGKDVLVTVEVPEDADKGNIESTFNELYEARLEAATANKLLQAEKEHKKDIIKVVELLKDSQTNIINENNAMNNSLNNSQNVTTGDINATNSIINLGDIKGKVSDNIKQLTDNTEDGKISIKQLLSQLKVAIETEENINNETKAEVLDSVNNITEAAKNPEDSNLKKMAKLSKNAILGGASHFCKSIIHSNDKPRLSALLKKANVQKWDAPILGIVYTLPTATKLVTECNNLLPAISELLGL